MRTVRGLLCFVVLVAIACSRPSAEVTSSPTAKPRPLYPRSCSSAEVNPHFFVGQEIFLTSEGFKPKQLISISGEVVTWINETDETQRIRFVNIEFAPGTLESPPLEPGGKVTYTPPGAISIVYQLGDDEKMRGAIQAEAYYQPGEDPAATARADGDADAPEPGCRGPQPQ